MNTRLTRRLAVVAAFTVSAGSVAGAQTGFNPSFQTPRVVGREFNVAVTDQYDTSLLFQWREGLAGGRSQFSLDLGYADGGSYRSPFATIDLGDFFLVGGNYGLQLATSNRDMPFDVLLTAGADAALGDAAKFVRIPVGASVGHRFPLEGTRMAVTPYVHPRLSLDFSSYSNCPATADCSDHELNFDFDLGVDWEFTPQFAARFSAGLGDADAIGIGFAWHPGRTTPATPRSGGRRR